MCGVGTVTNPEELAAAAAAGAQFAISPGITDELLVAAKAGDMPLIPGIATISELMQAKALGYTHFKFFPAESVRWCRHVKVDCTAPSRTCAFAPPAAFIKATIATTWR